MKKDGFHKSSVQIQRIPARKNGTVFSRRLPGKQFACEQGDADWGSLEEPGCAWQSSFSDRIRKTELLSAEAERELGLGLQAVRNELLQLLLGSRLALDWIFSDGKTCGAVDCKSLPKERAARLQRALREADALFLELQKRPSAVLQERFEAVRNGIRASLAGRTLHVSWMEPLFELIHRTRRDLARLWDAGHPTPAEETAALEALERALWIPTAEMNGFFSEIHRLHTEFLARRNRLVESNLRLVAALAERRRHLGLPGEDLVQEGNLALVSIAEFFNPARARFSTFATLKIDSFLLRANDNLGHFIGRPVHVCEKIRKLVKAERLWVEQSGENPSMTELSEASGIALEEIESLLRLKQPVDSLEAALAPGGPTLLDVLAENSEPAKASFFPAAA